MSEQAIKFFDGRRKVELDDWRPLMNSESEKRLRLDLLLPLTGETYSGLPAFVLDPYEDMEKEQSAVKEIDLGTELEGMTLEAYATDKSGPLEVEWDLGRDALLEAVDDAARKLLLTNCTLRNFKLVRVARGKEKLVCLAFSVTCKGAIGLAAWAYRYHGSTFWVQFSSDPAPLQKKIDETLAPGLPLTPMPTCPFPGCALLEGHEGRAHTNAAGQEIAAV